jgi:hypothetical protein
MLAKLELDKLRCTLMGFEISYQLKIPSKQTLPLVLLAKLATHQRWASIPGRVDNILLLEKFDCHDTDSTLLLEQFSLLLVSLEFITIT